MLVGHENRGDLVGITCVIRGPLVPTPFLRTGKCLLITHLSQHAIVHFFETLSGLPISLIDQNKTI